VSTPIDYDIIEQLARAVFGQISPITGTRATGTVRVDNTGATDAVIAQNSYLLPVVGSHAGPGMGELREDLVFKTRPNPATAKPHGMGGEWTVPAGESRDVEIWSNLGGVRHNLRATTLLRWDPPQFDLGPTVTLNAAMTDGADRLPGEVAVQRAIYFEELDSVSAEKDLQDARLNQLPAVMLMWQQSTPAEGRTAGTNQGSTRLAEGARLFAENFRLYVIVGDHSSDKRRRSGGLTVLQALTRLLSDQQQTRDFERICAVGSLEILSRARLSRGERHYIYSLSMRLNRVINRLEERTFTPWLKTHLQATLPGDPATVTDDMLRVDVLDPNPPGP
jgi:hypothetical protein